MNKKLQKLIELAIKIHSQIDIHIELSNLMRLADGDLSHIGDALLRGETILLKGDSCGDLGFGESAEHYSVKPKTRTVELPTPIKEGELKKGDKYWALNTTVRSGYVAYCYEGDELDEKILERGMAYRTEDDVKAVSAALAGE